MLGRLLCSRFVWQTTEKYDEHLESSSLFQITSITFLICSNRKSWKGYLHLLGTTIGHQPSAGPCFLSSASCGILIFTLDPQNNNNNNNNLVW